MGRKDQWRIWQGQRSRSGSQTFFSLATLGLAALRPVGTQPNSQSPSQTPTGAVWLREGKPLSPFRLYFAWALFAECLYAGTAVLLAVQQRLKAPQHPSLCPGCRQHCPAEVSPAALLGALRGNGKGWACGSCGSEETLCTCAERVWGKLRVKCRVSTCARGAQMGREGAVALLVQVLRFSSSR